MVKRRVEQDEEKRKVQRLGIWISSAVFSVGIIASIALGFTVPNVAISNVSVSQVSLGTVTDTSETEANDPKLFQILLPILGVCLIVCWFCSAYLIIYFKKPKLKVMLRNSNNKVDPLRNLNNFNHISKHRYKPNSDSYDHIKLSNVLHARTPKEVTFIREKPVKSRKTSFEHIPTKRNTLPEVKLKKVSFEKQSPIRSRTTFDHIPEKRNVLKSQPRLKMNKTQKEIALRTKESFDHISKQRNKLNTSGEDYDHIRLSNVLKQNTPNKKPACVKEEPIRNKESFDHISKQRNKLNQKNDENFDHIKLSDVLRQSTPKAPTFVKEKQLRSKKNFNHIRDIRKKEIKLGEYDHVLDKI